MKILYIAARDLLSADSPRAASITMRITLLARQHEVHVAFPPDEPRTDLDIRRAMPGIASCTLLEVPKGAKLAGCVLDAFARRLPFQVASCFGDDNIQLLSALVRRL